MFHYVKFVFHGLINMFTMVVKYTFHARTVFFNEIS